jgi:hypothetical protein
MRKLLLITALLLTSFAINAQYKVTVSSSSMNIRGITDTSFNQTSTAYSYGVWGDKLRFVGFGTQTYMFTPADIDSINGVSSVGFTATQLINSMDSIRAVPAVVVASGTYTPTLTLTTNITSATPTLCTYMRVGNTVTVSGQFRIRPSALVTTTLGISLPIASNFSTVYQAGGTASAMAYTESGGIQGNATTDVVEFIFIAVNLGPHDYCFTFSYQIL